MRIIIIRHGSAFPISDKYNEENRPLTEEGHKETKQLGRYLSNFNLYFTNIWSSPYLRAIQTKDNIFSSVNIHEYKVLDELKPFEAPEKILEIITKVYSKKSFIAVVSHQPLIGRILAKMMNTNKNVFKILPATLVELEIQYNKKIRFEYKLIRFLHPQHIILR